MTVLQSHSQKRGNQRLFFLYLIHCVLSGWSERAKLRHGQRLHLSAPFHAVVNLLQSLTRKIPISQLSPTSSTVISMISNRRTYLRILQVCLLLLHCSYSPENVESRFGCSSAKAEVRVSGISFRPCLLRGPGTRINENRNLLKWDPNLSRLKLRKDSFGRIEIWVCAV